MFAVNEPNIGEPGTVHVFPLLVSNDVSAIISRTAVLWCSLPPIEVAEPYSTEQFETKFFEADAC
jgi:hypothetical protein